MPESPIKLIAAPFTPFFRDGSLNIGILEKYATRLVADGVAGVFVCGTTGEGMSLSQSERKAVAEAWKIVAGDRLSVIVHVGHPSLEEAGDLARHADRIGADAIATIGPVFFSPSSTAELVMMCRAIAAYSERPFYYYHMPAMCRVPWPAGSFFERMAEAIPTFAGMKFTHEDISDFGKCLELAGDRHEVLFGRDEMLLSGIRRGARAAVGSTYNFWAPIYHSIWRTFVEHKVGEAEALQERCLKGIEIMIRYGGLPAIKAVLAESGIDCGPTRLPMKPLLDEEAQSLTREVRAIFDD